MSLSGNMIVHTLGSIEQGISYRGFFSALKYLYYEHFCLILEHKERYENAGEAISRCGWTLRESIFMKGHSNSI